MNCVLQIGRVKTRPVMSRTNDERPSRTQVDDQRVEEAQDVGRHRTGVQDRQTGHHGAKHRKAEPQTANRGQTRINKGEGTDDLDHGGPDAEPLAEFDLGEQLDLEGIAASLVAPEARNAAATTACRHNNFLVRAPNFGDPTPAASPILRVIPEFSTIRRKLARWAADNVRIIKDLKPPQPPGFNNRLSANWKLLLQIAQHAGGGWPEQACRSAIYLSRAPYEPSVGVQLLAALRAMFTKNRTEITSEQVVQELLADPNSPWHEYRGRGPITKNQVAALLRDYDIRPVVVHPTKRADFSRHGYRAAQFEDAFARFLPHEPNIRTLKSGREGM